MMARPFLAAEDARANLHRKVARQCIHRLMIIHVVREDGSHNRRFRFSDVVVPLFVKGITEPHHPCPDSVASLARPVGLISVQISPPQKKTINASAVSKNFIVSSMRGSQVNTRACMKNVRHRARYVGDVGHSCLSQEVTGFGKLRAAAVGILSLRHRYLNNPLRSTFRFLYISPRLRGSNSG
jgi:hypothetical protein